MGEEPSSRRDKSREPQAFRHQSGHTLADATGGKDTHRGTSRMRDWSRRACVFARFVPWVPDAVRTRTTKLRKRGTCRAQALEGGPNRLAINRLGLCASSPTRKRLARSACPFRCEGRVRGLRHVTTKSLGPRHRGSRSVTPFYIAHYENQTEDEEFADIEGGARGRGYHTHGHPDRTGSRGSGAACQQAKCMTETPD